VTHEFLVSCITSENSFYFRRSQACSEINCVRNTSFWSYQDMRRQCSHYRVDGTRCPRLVDYIDSCRVCVRLQIIRDVERYELLHRPWIPVPPLLEAAADVRSPYEGVMRALPALRG
jgi:hypothetical protein